jgi:hypothetical protein
MLRDYYTWRGAWYAAHPAAWVAALDSYGVRTGV